MTYGWVRAEILGGLVNGILLLSLVFNIVIEAIQRFVQIERESYVPLSIKVDQI